MYLNKFCRIDVPHVTSLCEPDSSVIETLINIGDYIWNANNQTFL